MNEYELTYEKHSEKSLAESGRQVLLLLLLMPPLGRTLLSLGPGEAAGWVLGLFTPWPHLLISTLFFWSHCYQDLHALGVSIYEASPESL